MWGNLRVAFWVCGIVDGSPERTDFVGRMGRVGSGGAWRFPQFCGEGALRLGILTEPAICEWEGSFYGSSLSSVKVKVKSLSLVRISATPWTVAH